MNIYFNIIKLIILYMQDIQNVLKILYIEHIPKFNKDI